MAGPVPGLTEGPAPLTSQFAGGARGLKERFRALMDASAKRPGRAALLLVLCAALLGGPLVACQSRAPEESLPDGTYWATLSLSDWWTAGEEGIELLLSLAEVDTDTMTLLSVAPEKTSLPVADDVTLGNHGDSGLDGFLQWASPPRGYMSGSTGESCPAPRCPRAVWSATRWIRSVPTGMRG